MRRFGCDGSCKYHFKEFKKSEPKFCENGNLNPDEFIKAGDYLISKCPFWKWCSVKESFYNKKLPKNKQYLKATVPCYKRAIEYIKYMLNKTIEKVIDNDWVNINVNKDNQNSLSINLKNEDDKPRIDLDLDDNDDDDFKIEDEDSDDFIIEGDDNSKVDCIIEDEEDIKKSNRIYDITITYDLYYFVPRLCFMGYNEKGIPLTDEEMKEDIMPEHRNKTITIDPHPSTGLRNLSIHPCRHSLIFKKLINDFQREGTKFEPHMSIIFLFKI